MKMHSITVELDSRDPGADQADQLMTDLEQLHPAVSTSPRGWLTVTITIPAEHVGQAVTLAIAAVEQAAGHPTIAVTAMTETEADAREGWETPSELVSVKEAADILGVSRQAVLDRIARHTLPASKVGRGYTIPRAALAKPMGLRAAIDSGEIDRADKGLTAALRRGEGGGDRRGLRAAAERGELGRGAPR